MNELVYVALLFALFVVPRVVARFQIPTAITSVGLGAAAGMGLGVFDGDPVVKILATLGIVALFLFAGLEVEVRELRREWRVLVEHIAIRLATLAAATHVLSKLLHLELRPASLVALALFTPSTGFILDSLARLNLTERQRFWVRSKAIATEIVALGVLFVALQSTSAASFSLSTAALVGMVALLPLVFRLFAKAITPHAPKSEFSFLVMIAVVCAVATRKLGVYYLVGAFVVGMTAQQFRSRLPSLANEKMMDAVEAFASLFVPFYFFSAGLHLRASDFSVAALATGALFIVCVVPLRLALTVIHRRLRMGDSLRAGLRVGVPMLPTLVFTLVIAEILRDRFGVPQHVFGGLIIYTLVNTLIPSLALRLPPPEFDAPEAPPPRELPAAPPAPVEPPPPSDRPSGP